MWLGGESPAKRGPPTLTPRNTPSRAALLHQLVPRPDPVGRSLKGPECAVLGLCPAVAVGHRSWGLATSSDSGKWAWPCAALSCPLASHQGHPVHQPPCPSPVTPLPSSHAKHLPVGRLGSADRGQAHSQKGSCSWAPSFHPYTPPHTQRHIRCGGAHHPHQTLPPLQLGEATRSQGAAPCKE